MSLKIFLQYFCFSHCLLVSSLSFGHHVLGRPSYSLNEDSNTPPSMAVETQVGEYLVTYMVFPAFPKPNEPGRVNLYATRIDNGQTLQQNVKFTVREDGFFAGSSSEETLGVQEINDGVYRQGFIFKKKGQYLIRANFTDGGQPYVIDFPLDVGSPNAIGPIGGTVAIILLLLISINIVHRRRIARSKIQQGQRL